MKNSTLLSVFTVLSSFAAMAEGVFSIAPYVVRDENHRLLARFEVSKGTEMQVGLRQKEGDVHQEAILITKTFEAGKTHEVILEERSCQPEALLEFRATGITAGRLSHASVRLPPEACRQQRASGPTPPFVLRPVLFGLMSDTQTFSNRHALVGAFIKKMVASLPLQFVLNAGDLVDVGSSEEQWRGFFNVAHDYLQGVPIVAALGNHEYYGQKGDGVIPPLFQRYMRWDGASDGGHHAITYPLFELIVLNSNLHHMSDKQKKEQLNWLETRLLANQMARRVSIVATHYPLISSSAWTVADTSSRELRKTVLPMLEKYNVKLVLAGHTHVYERSLKDGVHHVIAGPAGGMVSVSTSKNPYQQFIKRGAFTFTLLAVGTDAISVRTFDQEGKSIDEVSIPMPYSPRP